MGWTKEKTKQEMLAIEAASTNERKEGGIWVRRMVQIIQGISIEHLADKERSQTARVGTEHSTYLHTLCPFAASNFDNVTTLISVLK